MKKKACILNHFGCLLMLLFAFHKCFLRSTPAWRKNTHFEVQEKYDFFGSASVFLRLFFAPCSPQTEAGPKNKRSWYEQVTAMAGSRYMESFCISQVVFALLSQPFLKLEIVYNCSSTIKVH